MHLELTAIIVHDYDEAISFFVDVLGFELVEDSRATTNDGRPKRWVVVRPSGAETGVLLVQIVKRRDEFPERHRRVGRQLGRVLRPFVELVPAEVWGPDLPPAKQRLSRRAMSSRSLQRRARRSLSRTKVLSVFSTSSPSSLPCA